MTITKFLQILGIREKTAKLDAEGIEHHLHKETVNRIKRFVEFIDKHPSWFKVFEETENQRRSKG
jgi:Mn-dependent DtxR family transcriptional regulator